MKIIAFDPGGTTGWAGCLSSNERAREWEYSGGQIGPHDHHNDLWQFLKRQNPAAIVYEAFNYQIRRNQGTDMPGVVLMSREYIGIIRLYGEAFDVPVYKQQPSIIGLAYLKDSALKQAGLHTAGEPHHNDATRHLLYHLIYTRGQDDVLEWLSPR